MPIKTKLKACVLALMLAVPLSAGAVGLGRLNVLSGLGQPFRAEIDLVSVQPGEAETLVARLAPAETFAQAQVPYPSAAMGLRLTIEKRANGQSFVSVSSAQSVSEPFLDLLINLKWADGQIQREYTALIDPVGYTPSASGANARSGEQFAPSVLPGTRRKGAIKAPARVAPAKAAAASVQPAADNQSADNQYKVKAGDTLSAVARQNMEEGVSLEQMLVGLYRQNPGAFDGNMNRLRRGRILNIPSKEALQAVAPKEAGQEVRLQSKDWQAYRSKLAEAVQKRQPVAGNESANTGKISPKVEEKLAPGGAKQDVLKLSKGEAPGKAKGDSAAQDKLRALEEEVAARQKGLDESNQRVAELQKNLHDMEKLLALKSRAGTELQQASQVAAPAEAEAAVASSAASAPAETVAQVAASEVVAPKKKIRRPVPVVEPVPEPGLLDVVLDNSLPIGGGLAAILLGGAGIWWSRRRKQGSAFADSVLTGGDLKSNTLLGNTGGAVISTQPTENSFLTDFSRQGLGTIDTDEVDPIAEAEVYMAYDRNEQAEEILRDALAKDPSRHEIRLKLLEIFSAKKDKTSFEEIAADLFTLTAGKGAQWEQAAYQGRAIDPENPLYREQELSGTVPATAAASSFDAFDLEIDEPVPEDTDTMPDFGSTNVLETAGLSGAVSDSPGDLDFSLDFDSAEPEIVPELIDFNAPAEPDALPEAYEKPLADFDFLPSDAEPAAVPEAAEETAAEDAQAAVTEPVDDFGMGLDFGLDDFLVPGDEVKAAEPVMIPKPAADDLMLDLDLPVDFSVPAAPQAAPESFTPQAESVAFDDPFDLDFTGLDGVSEPVVIPAAVPDLPDLNLDALPSLEDFSVDELAPALPDAPLAAEEVLEATSADDGMGLDFDFSLDTVPDMPAAAAAEAPLDLGDLGLNFDAGTDFAADAVAEFAGDDPVQTKIDLAKAYLDMGDTEGAREILQEALSEGNPAQQKQAQALLGNL